MAEAAAAAAAAEEEAMPLLGNLPDEIVMWEILVRLDPKSLLRCRAVRRAWRSATSTRRFLLAHHARQPALPILRSGEHHTILAFDHRAAPDAQLHAVARLDKGWFLNDAFCDGLLILSNCDSGTRRLSVCNPATREHVSLGPLPEEFSILGMYPHRATGEYRLLLQPRGSNLADLPPEGQAGLHVLALGSDQPPRYVRCSETKLVSAFFHAPVLLRDCLHWYPVYYLNESNRLEAFETDREMVIVFDTVAESFRQMRPPVVTTGSYIFEMDDTLGIYSCNKAMEVVDIWVLRNYESQVWDFKYRVQLPMAEIRGKIGGRDGDGYWYLTVASGDGDVLLLLSLGRWLFYVDTDGKLVASFQDLSNCKLRLKQTLVQNDFFTTPEGFAMEDSPFI